MQENTAMVPLGYKESKQQGENIKDVMRKKDAKSTVAPGNKGSFLRLSFFGLVKFSTKKGVTGREHSTKQSARDTGDGERKGRGGKWMPLSSGVR